MTLATTGEWIHWLDTLGVVTLCAKQNTCIMVALKQVSRGSGSFTNEFLYAVLINQERKHILTSNSLLLFQLTANSATILAQPPAHKA